MNESPEARKKPTLESKEGKRHKRKAKDESKHSESGFSLTCCRKKQQMKRVDARKGRGKGKEKKHKKSRSRKSKSKSKKKRRRSKKSRKSRKRRSKKRSRKSRKAKSRTSTSARKARMIRDNREHLIKSQSLTTPTKSGESTEGAVKDSPFVSYDAPITPYSPMKKDKKTKMSEDVHFQPHRSSDDRAYRKKDEEAPSTAIDIDSSIRKRRTKKPRKAQYGARGPAKKGEERRKEEYKYLGPPVQEPASEPGIQRASELIPLEEDIDPNYPAQRIVISNFVRNGCHVKRWLYEDSYPIDGPRPSIYDLTGSRSRKQYSTCCCGRRYVCDGCCGRDLMAKQRALLKDSEENDRIRGELQRLDVILRNLDD
ncbi:hypothetical protein RB195_001160 [Necator americanus]|uniref:Uncharacterized protein n=1 Tax=Necator americanus TaxID=51031 RepID=A0ABR1DCZ2_NECAM